MNDKGCHIEYNDVHEIEVFSDASGDGYGGYVSLGAGASNEETEVFGSWNHDETRQSSSWREAEAVQRVLRSNVQILQNKKVRWFTDNRNVKKIIKSGSKKQDLQQIALSIHDVCNKEGIIIQPEWIKRTDNIKADKLSRTKDSDDWQIDVNVFYHLDSVWGPHTIDRFATNLSSHCNRFNSRFWCPGTSGVDAFSQSWSNECNWIVPPPGLILRVLKKMQKEKAIGTLVVPQWKSAPFWSELVSENGTFRDFVKDSKILQQQDVITQSHSKFGIFSENPLKFKLVALRIGSGTAGTHS